MNDQNLINRINAWLCLYDFSGKYSNQNFIISDGDMLDDAKGIFTDIIKNLNV